MSQIEKTKSDISLRRRKNKAFDKNQLKQNDFKLSIYEKRRIPAIKKELFIVPWQLFRENDS